MDADISAVLAYEIKKEIAERYFGFRKLIEQEKDELAQQIRHYSLTVEQKICHDLVRIYIMLREEALIHYFFQLTGLNEDIFYDHYTIHSPTIKKRVFTGMTIKGLTKAGRFKNMFLTCYDTLARHVQEYRDKIAELSLEHDTIIEEINLFYRKNDLSLIMGFLRSLDAASHMGSDLHSAASGLVSPELFNQKMKISPPSPIEEALSILPPLPQLSQVKKPLKRLAEKAFLLHSEQLF